MNYRTLTLSRAKRKEETELKRQRKLKALIHNTDARFKDYRNTLFDVEVEYLGVETF